MSTTNKSNAAIMALDVGEKRIGVAIASRESRLPRALSTLVSGPKIYEVIINMIAAHNADTIVIGLPRNLNGDDTEQTRFVRKFAHELEDQYGSTIYFMDEAGTSLQAEQELRERRKPYSKSDIDGLSAVYILQDFLNTPEAD